MNKKILEQLLLRGLLISPIIAILVCSPLYLIRVEPQITFFKLWFNLTLGTLVCWGVQIFIFSFFKNRGYANWQYVLCFSILLIAIMLGTNPFISSSNEFFQSASNISIFLFRFSLISAINLMIYLIIDLVYTQEKRVQLIEENARLQFSNLESEYKLLKAQINPHFLFNALNISKSLIKTQPQNAEKYILGLSEFLRNSLNVNQKSITLKKELAHCQQYIDLQKVRFGQAIQYQVKVEEIHLEKQLPFFSLITLVENAIKHNSFSEEAPLKITVQVVEDFLCIKNNMKPKSGVVSTHTGLSNLNQRSEMLSNAKIKIENDGQHFFVKVKLMEL